MSEDVNTYSPIWFDMFLAPYPQVWTDNEIAFLARHLPLPAYREVLDLCCGTGRHAVSLAALGYHVTGVDRDASALAIARQQAGEGALFIEGDMRFVVSLPGMFDAALSLWQSFGYFDAETNGDVLRQIRGKLHSRGRLVLDIYHRGFFEAHGSTGERTLERTGRTISETRRLDGDRLTVTLDYGNGVPTDVFSWQLYTPEEMVALAEGIGFRLVMLCTQYDETQSATPASPRMQLVFEKAT